ncbi:MAG: hypothetical protein SNG35_08615 [Rikenellaceae bacterium]
MEEGKDEFFLNIIYKGKKVKFKVMNSDSNLDQLLHNVRHATGVDGKLIFDFPSIDYSGAPMEYLFAKEDGVSHEIRVLRSKIGKSNQKLVDYSIDNGDTVHIIPDPYPG